MMIVAQHIWSDGAASRSVFAWNSLSEFSPDRLCSMRAAGLALHVHGNLAMAARASAVIDPAYGR
jgi:hypothetical protein